MIGMLIEIGAVMVIRGGLPVGDLQMSRRLEIVLEMIVIALLAIRMDTRLLNGRP